MSVRTSHPSLPSSPKTVGSVASRTLLEHTFSLEEADIIEFRLDALVRSLPEVKNKLLELKNSQLQTLITARCPTEGGENGLTLEQRSQLIMGLAPLATFVDIELANLEAMAESARFAQSMNSLVVASFHDFKKTPSIEVLREKVQQSIAQGADIAKIAVYHKSIDDLHACAQLLQEGHSIAISLMGMGPLAPSSRLLYAQLGSVLNYGFLGNKPTAPGQWPAQQLHQAIQNSPQF